MKKLLLKIMSPEGCDANSRQVAILLATLITLVLGVVLYSAMHILHPVEPKSLSNALYTPPGFKPLEFNSPPLTAEEETLDRKTAIVEVCIHGEPVGYKIGWVEHEGITYKVLLHNNLKSPPFEGAIPDSAFH